MSQNLYDAHRQWARRPADERFENLDNLLAFTEKRKNQSHEENRFLRSISLEATGDGGIIMNGNGSPAYFSNWAFGQLCRTLSAPAGYLRTLSPELARDCLQYGLKSSNEECMLLIRNYSHELGNHDEKYASAFTSSSYGRIWDANAVESIMQAINGTSWHVPHSHNGSSRDNSGLYASDHDMFAFFINDENPVEVGNAKLGRGFFCWNSETGASTFGLTTFLYNYVCANHIVWGAEQVQGLKIIHKRQAPDRFYNEAIPILNGFVENHNLEENIKSLAHKAMNQYVGNNLGHVFDWFKGRPFTIKEIADGWQTGIAEGEDVTNLWGMVQGLTATARDMRFGDKKVDLERRAGSLLAAR
jgi:hypothetical protein